MSARWSAAVSLLLAGCAAHPEPGGTQPDGVATTVPASSAPSGASAAVPIVASAPPPAPLPAKDCDDRRMDLGARLIATAPRSAKNAGASVCKVDVVTLGRGAPEPRLTIAGGPQGAIAAWQSDEHTVLAALYSATLEPSAQPVAVGRFEAPLDVKVVALSRGGLVLTRSKEADGERWYASFLDGKGALVGPPVATGLAPDQLVRETLLADNDTVQVLQYPVYAFGVPAKPRPLVVSALRSDAADTCSTRIDLQGRVDARFDVPAVDGESGPGFVVHFIEGTSDALPPLKASRTLLARHKELVQNPVSVGAAGPVGLDFVPSLEAPKFLRTKHSPTPGLIEEMAPPVDVAAAFGPRPFSPDSYGLAVWTGAVTAVPLRFGADVQVLRIDCRP